MTMLLVLPVVISMVTATSTLLALKRVAAQQLMSLGGSIAQLFAASALLHAVDHRGPQAVQLGAWPPPYAITFVVDRFSALMLVLSGVLAVVTSIYATSGIDRGRQANGFYPLMHTLLMGTNGVFVSGDLFNLYVWFELTLISSFVLLVLGNERQQIRAALKYVALNLISSALFLTGIAILYGSVHALNLADLSLKVPTLALPVRTTLAMMFLVAFGIKAAVFPLFFWLPEAYPAPPVAVTALFAGLLTKVGVYALVRVFTLVFAEHGAYARAVILAIAGLTMTVGVLGAVAQMEVRRILAFHSVSQIGYMVMGLGLFTASSLAGTALFVLHHGVVKSNLFLISGLMRADGRDARLELQGGLMRGDPLLSACFLVTALSLAGTPPLSGFWAKLLLVEAGLEAHTPAASAVVVTGLLVGLLTLLSMTKIWNEAFWKPAPRRAAHEEARPTASASRARMVLSVALLTGLSVALGAAPEPVIGVVLRAGDELADPPRYVNAVLRGSGEGARP